MTIGRDAFIRVRQEFGYLTDATVALPSCLFTWVGAHRMEARIRALSMTVPAVVVRSTGGGLSVHRRMVRQYQCGPTLEVLITIRLPHRRRLNRRCLQALPGCAKNAKSHQESIVCAILYNQSNFRQEKAKLTLGCGRSCEKIRINGAFSVLIPPTAVKESSSFERILFVGGINTLKAPFIFIFSQLLPRRFCIECGPYASCFRSFLAAEILKGRLATTLDFRGGAVDLRVMR